MSLKEDLRKIIFCALEPIQPKKDSNHPKSNPLEGMYDTDEIGKEKTSFIAVTKKAMRILKGSSHYREQN